MPSEDSDQPAYSRGLIRIFNGHILNSQGCKFLPADKKDLSWYGLDWLQSFFFFFYLFLSFSLFFFFFSFFVLS